MKNKKLTVEESVKKLLESEKVVTPESMIQDIATHLGKTIPETMEHIENFSNSLEKLKNKET